jgi:hypothetical protein
MGPAGPIGNISEQQTGAASGPVLVGEILTINREFDFVVISLGKVDGIKEGMALQVYRDENRLGQIEIETVRDNISAAAITDKENLSRMRPGDKVSMPLGA